MFKTWLEKLDNSAPGGGVGEGTQQMSLPFFIPFFTKMYPFNIPSIEKWYPFHTTSLELCIPFNCCKFTVF